MLPITVCINFWVCSKWNWYTYYFLTGNCCKTSSWNGICKNICFPSCLNFLENLWLVQWIPVFFLTIACQIMYLIHYLKKWLLEACLRTWDEQMIDQTCEESKAKKIDLCSTIRTSKVNQALMSWLLIQGWDSICRQLVLVTGIQKDKTSYNFSGKWINSYLFLVHVHCEPSWKEHFISKNM